MKLSFSTKGWHDARFEDFFDIAQELKFEGIELHNIHNRLFTDKDGAFHDYAAAATLRKLYEKNLQLTCIDAVCDVSDKSAYDDTMTEIKSCIEIAKNLKIPYVRLRAEKEYSEEIFSAVETLLKNIIPQAEENGVTLLLETSGMFADTSVLRDMLERFACDNLALECFCGLFHIRRKTRRDH